MGRGCEGVERRRRGLLFFIYSFIYLNPRRRCRTGSNLIDFGGCGVRRVYSRRLGVDGEESIAACDAALLLSLKHGVSSFRPRPPVNPPPPPPPPLRQQAYREPPIFPPPIIHFVALSSSGWARLDGRESGDAASNLSFRAAEICSSFSSCSFLPSFVHVSETSRQKESTSFEHLCGVFFGSAVCVRYSHFCLLNNSIKFQTHFGQQFKIIFITADYFLDCVIKCFFF